MSTNEHFFERVRTVVRAAAALDSEGHRILSADLGLGSLKPTIQVATDARLAEKIEADEACYYKWAHKLGLQTRHGQFEREGCRVVWAERGN